MNAHPVNGAYKVLYADVYRMQSEKRSNAGKREE
jgi:hypothetical protein